MTLSRCANYGCRVVHCLVFDPGGVKGSRTDRTVNPATFRSGLAYTRTAKVVLPRGGHEAFRAMETKLNNFGLANCIFAPGAFCFCGFLSLSYGCFLFLVS